MEATTEGTESSFIQGDSPNVEVLTGSRGTAPTSALGADKLAPFFANPPTDTEPNHSPSRPTNMAPVVHDAAPNRTTPQTATADAQATNVVPDPLTFAAPPVEATTATKVEPQTTPADNASTKIASKNPFPLGTTSVVAVTKAASGTAADTPTANAGQESPTFGAPSIQEMTGTEPKVGDLVQIHSDYREERFLEFDRKWASQQRCGRMSGGVILTANPVIPTANTADRPLHASTEILQESSRMLLKIERKQGLGWPKIFARKEAKETAKREEQERRVAKERDRKADQHARKQRSRLDQLGNRFQEQIPSLLSPKRGADGYRSSDTSSVSSFISTRTTTTLSSPGKGPGRPRKEGTASYEAVFYQNMLQDCQVADKQKKAVAEKVKASEIREKASEDWKVAAEHHKETGQKNSEDYYKHMSLGVEVSTNPERLQALFALAQRNAKQPVDDMGPTAGEGAKQPNDMEPPTKTSTVPAIVFGKPENAMRDKVAIPKETQKARMDKSKEAKAKARAKASATSTAANNFKEHPKSSAKDQRKAKQNEKLNVHRKLPPVHPSSSTFRSPSPGEFQFASGFNGVSAPASSMGGCSSSRTAGFSSSVNLSDSDMDEDL
eukprot:scaffold98_cov172-Amphora_coffeaeformis.AAC.1